MPYANPVTPELAGPHHQHVFGFRLDFTLDGAENAVYEVDAVPVPTGPDNPYGNAFTAQATLLETELQAQRMAAAEKSRYWKIVNHGVRNAVGEPVAYKLVPAHATAPLLAQPDASITARATFGTKHLWVTPFAADERRAAGDFPNQHPGGDGLPRWTAADRPVVDTDIVVWHTVGVTHSPAGGFPGDAGGVHRVHAEAVRLLRPEPRPRPGAVGRGGRNHCHPTG